MSWTSPGAGDAFAVFILSDTRGAGRRPPNGRQWRRSAPRTAIRSASTTAGAPSNTGFKAGNIMDFLDHHAEGFELMLTLDADSEMSAAAVLRLVRAMQADPTLAIAQHLTVGLPAVLGLSAAVPVRHARGDAHLGDRAGLVAGRRRSLLGPQRRGAHRAVPRALPAAAAAGRSAHPVARPGRGGACCVAPAGASACCRTRTDPGRPIRRRCRNSSAATCAGWPATCSTGTCCGCRDCGRWDAGSSARRSCCSPARRSICCSCWPPRRQPRLTRRRPFRPRRPSALTVAWLGALYAPKLLGYAEVALSPDKRQRYGGLARFAGGALAEIRFHPAARCHLGGGEDRRHAAAARSARPPAGRRRTAASAA